MQPFQGTPVGIPVRYDAARKQIWLLGVHCGFSCALSHIRFGRPTGVHPMSEYWLSMLARDHYGVNYRIYLAPPRQKLNCLYVENGCNMQKAIEAFRSHTDHSICKISTHPFVRATYIADEWEINKRKRTAEENYAKQMQQPPKPLILTKRGQYEQKKYVVQRSKPPKTASVGIYNLIPSKKRKQTGQSSNH